MRILLYALLLMPHAFAYSDDKSKLDISLNTDEYQYVFSQNDKSTLIKSVNLWIDIIDNKSQVIDEKSALFFDQLRKTYPKNSPADGIFAYKKTPWGMIYLTSKTNVIKKEKEVGNITLGRMVPKTIMTNFNPDNFLKDIGLKFIDSNKKETNYCSIFKKDGSCEVRVSWVYYQYYYRSLRHPDYIITFDVKEDVNQFNTSAQYPQNFTSMAIEFKPED